MIFITLAKYKDKTVWRWYGWIKTCSSTYGM